MRKDFIKTFESFNQDGIGSGKMEILNSFITELEDDGFSAKLSEERHDFLPIPGVFETTLLIENGHNIPVDKIFKVINELFDNMDSSGILAGAVFVDYDHLIDGSSVPRQKRIFARDGKTGFGYIYDGIRSCENVVGVTGIEISISMN